jgi:hypoxanthine-guanine phosphoribosyltransferase
VPIIAGCIDVLLELISVIVFTAFFDVLSVSGYSAASCSSYRL